MGGTWAAPESGGPRPRPRLCHEGPRSRTCPAPCFQPPSPQPLTLPRGPLRDTGTGSAEGSENPLHTHWGSFPIKSATLATAWQEPGSRAPLCSAQKPLDSETGDPSVPEQIPSPSATGLFPRRPGAHSPLPSPWRLRCHFLPEVGGAPRRPRGSSVSRWSLCSPTPRPLQHQPQSSSPAYNSHLSLDEP